MIKVIYNYFSIFGKRDYENNVLSNLENNQMRMRRYRRTASTLQKLKIRKYDILRKHNCRPEKGLKFSSPMSYRKTLEASKAIGEILEDNPQMHSEILSHVLMDTLKSPHKRKSMEKLSAFITPSKGIDHDKVMNDKSEQHTLNNLIRKLTVYHSKGQKPKARKIVDRKIVDQFLVKGNRKVTKIASASGHYFSNIYRLMSSPKKRQKEVYTKKLSEEMKQKVIDFYYSEEISYGLLEVNYVDMHFMNCTINEAYCSYILKISGKSERKIARSTIFVLFKKLHYEDVNVNVARTLGC